MTIPKLVFILLLSLPLWSLSSGFAKAQSIPLNGLSLRLEPLSEDEDRPLAKEITVERRRKTYKIKWYSLDKQRDEMAKFPTYRIRARQGLVECDSFDLMQSLYLPGLWADGYVRTQTMTPLWVRPELLDMPKRKRMPLHVGLVETNSFLLKRVPDQLFSALSYFQNLYGQFVVDGSVRVDIPLKRSERRDFERMSVAMGQVKRLAKTKTDILVRSKRDSLESVLLGNDYYQVTVLNDPLNPLVLGFRMIDNKVPKPLRESFDDLKKKLEFRVSQILF